jgi:hypothetical protein
MGMFTKIVAPGAEAGVTHPYKINDAAQIVGSSTVGSFLYFNGTFTQIAVRRADLIHRQRPTASTTWGRSSEVLTTASPYTGSSTVAGPSPKSISPAHALHRPTALTT